LSLRSRSASWRSREWQSIKQGEKMNETSFTPSEEAKESRYLDPREDVNVVKISKIIDRCIDGDQAAKEELVNNYEWLIDNIIIKYFDNESDTEHEDLKQEGRLAILNSIKYFDKGKIINPTHYLRDAIYHRLVNVLQVNQLVHIGKQIHQVRKLESVEAKNPEAGQEKLYITDEENEKTKKAARAIDTIQTIDIDETEDVESLTTEQQQAVEVLVTNKDTLKELESLCAPREIEIMKLRFGFDGQARTLEEVGREMNLSKARIQQILHRAIKKIRKHLNVKLDESEITEELAPEEIQRRKEYASRLQRKYRMNGLLTSALAGDAESRDKYINHYIIDNENFLRFFHINYQDLKYDEIVNETKRFIGEMIDQNNTFSPKQLNDHLLDWAEERRKEIKEEDRMTVLLRRALHDLEARKEFIESHEPLIDEIIDQHFQKYKALDYETMKKNGINQVYNYFTVACLGKYSKQDVSDRIYYSLHSWVSNLPIKYQL